MFAGAKLVLYASALLLITSPPTLRAEECAQSNAVDQRLAHGPGYQVNVHSVLDWQFYSGGTLDWCCFSGGGTVVHKISYSYWFEGRPSVFISSMGLAPPSGSFTYFTSEPCLEFRASEKGEILASVPLKGLHYGSYTGEPIWGRSDSVGVPEQARLSGPFRELTWSPDTTFPVFIRTLFEKYFPFGFEVREIGNVHYYISTFHTLQTTSNQLLSQVAIALSQPYGTTGKSLVYHVQFVMRDRPRLSSTFRYGDEVAVETSNAAQAFVSEVIREANTQGGHK